MVIIPAEPEKAKAYWKKNKIPAVGLFDPEREVMQAYGQEFSIPKLGWMPATIALNSDHEVTYTHYGSGQRDVAGSDEIARLMEELAA